MLDLHFCRYVNRLAAGVARHLHVCPHRFVCFTENAEGIDTDAVEVKPLLVTDMQGWWNKISLFRSDIGLTGRLLYIDLDTVITGSLDDIAAYQGPFATLSTRGFENEQDYLDGYNSSIMAWEAGFGHEVARVFERYAEHIVELCVSDQEYLEMMMLNADLVQDIWPNQVREYKGECTAGVPSGTSIVTFPLIPKPHQYPSPWIAELWVE